MTILNILVEHQRALVGVDTEAITADGTRFQVSKLLPVVHLNAVLTGRGAAVVQLGLWAWICATRHDLDTVADEAAAFLNMAFKSTEPQPSEPPVQQAIALVGWSPRQSRIIGRVFTREDLATGFVARDIAQYYWAPLDPSFGEMSYFHDMGGLENLARAQERLITEKEPAAAAGGRLICAKITRCSVEIYGPLDVGFSRG